MILCLFVLMIFMCLCSCCCGIGTYHSTTHVNKHAVARNHQQLPQSDYDDVHVKTETHIVVAQPQPTQYVQQHQPMMAANPM